jgi:hypothetical protein
MALVNKPRPPWGSNIKTVRSNGRGEEGGEADGTVASEFIGIGAPSPRRESPAHGGLAGSWASEFMLNSMVYETQDTFLASYQVVLSGRSTTRLRAGVLPYYGNTKLVA